jgi:hypothetical protein
MVQEMAVMSVAGAVGVVECDVHAVDGAACWSHGMAIGVGVALDGAKQPMHFDWAVKC